MEPKAPVNELRPLGARHAIQIGDAVLARRDSAEIVVGDSRSCVLNGLPPVQSEW